MVAPDEEFALQPVQNFLKDCVPRGGFSGLFYSEASLDAAAEAVVERLLRKIVTRTIAGNLNVVLDLEVYRDLMAALCLLL